MPRPLREGFSEALQGEPADLIWTDLLSLSLRGPTDAELVVRSSLNPIAVEFLNEEHVAAGSQKGLTDAGFVGP